MIFNFLNLFSRVNEPDDTPFTTWVSPGNQYNYYTYGKFFIQMILSNF